MLWCQNIALEVSIVLFFFFLFSRTPNGSILVPPSSSRHVYFGVINKTSSQEVPATNFVEVFLLNMRFVIVLERNLRFLPS